MEHFPFTESTYYWQASKLKEFVNNINFMEHNIIFKNSSMIIKSFFKNYSFLLDFLAWNI